MCDRIASVRKNRLPIPSLIRRSPARCTRWTESLRWQAPRCRARVEGVAHRRNELVNSHLPVAVGVSSAAGRQSEFQIFFLYDRVCESRIVIRTRDCVRSDVNDAGLQWVEPLLDEYSQIENV